MSFSDFISLMILITSIIEAWYISRHHKRMDETEAKYGLSMLFFGSLSQLTLLIKPGVTVDWFLKMLSIIVCLYLYRKLRNLKTAN